MNDSELKEMETEIADMTQKLKQSAESQRRLDTGSTLQNSVIVPRSSDRALVPGVGVLSRGLALATLPTGNQEPLMVKTRMEYLQVSLG